MNLEDFRLSVIATHPTTYLATFFIPEHALIRRPSYTTLDDVCAAVADQCGCKSVKLLSFEGMVDCYRRGHDCFIEFQKEEESTDAGHNVEAVASES